MALCYDDSDVSASIYNQSGSSASGEDSGDHVLKYFCCSKSTFATNSGENMKQNS